MSEYSVQSRCECQAILSATLDENRQVRNGWAARGRGREVAPAHSIGSANERFDIGWLCPYCGRNTLRTFYAGALRPVKGSETPAT
ncbi:hypothetical protein [Polyangium aurulentum]|uniref:hypothetical protein n=1 Tax=Polyangium aurulentum TaxID=2567896 RepID=UPI0010AE19CA|nr:hypothetical protein [Polyangium aurulentum]UQA56635.1 hypothetical protein E8A73_035810 [Polyangium aurulentum]